MATTITVQALLRNEDSNTIPFVAGEAYNPGDIQAVGDGRVGLVSGLQAVASGDPCTLVVKGQVDLRKNATSDTYAVGASVWWDDSANKAKTSFATGYLYAGRCVKTSANGDTYVYTDLNVGGSPPVLGLTGGYMVARGGAAALDGSNPTPITTGLSTIVAACVQLRGTAAPGDNTSVLTTDFSGSDGTLNVYAWKNTSGSDPTLVASTGTETFDWFAIGT